MWFKRKAKNRRFERSHVLDVKLRSQQVRAVRFRLLSGVLGVSFGTLLVLFLLWQGGSFVLDRLVFQNPAFAITKIEVQTDGDLPLIQLRRWAGVKEGDNLFALDLARVRRDLELVPWIRAASIERVIPHTLRLSVSEREPVAQASKWQPAARGNGLEPVVFLLDADGYVMRPRDAWAAVSLSVSSNAPLPRLTGVDDAELRPGRQIESEQARAALRLVDAFDRSPMFNQVELNEIDVAMPDLLRVTTCQSNDVTFAVAGLETQLSRWRLIHDAGLSSRKGIATLDLSVSNHIPATWFEASALPAVKPKAVKTSRTRKKHV